MTSLEDLKDDLLGKIAGAESLEALEAIRVAALGRKGALTQLMKTLGELTPDERRERGQVLNTLKGDLSAAITSRHDRLKDAALEAELQSQSTDISQSPRPRRFGHLHPISQTTEEMVAIFGEMGFSVAEGPHIEDDFHNFTALNIPPDHPARQEHDTFYLPGKTDDDRKVLRTHTSPVQIRTMTGGRPPFRVIVPGRTFRADHDATHSPMFHQIEGLVVDESTHMGHLKGTLIGFCRAYFGIEDLPVRFRPSYFPFTEPSAEVDIGCSRKGGGLTIGAGEDWLEILGCGMVHPKVLENCGISILPATRDLPLASGSSGRPC